MTKKIQRSFIVGDNWVYFKIYTGTKTADSILVEIINPLTAILIEQKIIDKWFFIRYGDPKNHLRVRLHCIDRSDINKVMSLMMPHFDHLIKEDLIWKLQTDTYQRELERYGENTMELSEEMFFHDSSLIINALELIGGEDDELRWLFALRSIDNLLNNFKFSTEKKLMIFEHLKNGFAMEFGVKKDVNKQIDFKYRNHRNQIEEILSANKESSSVFFHLIDILDVFNNSIKPIAEQILEFNNKDLLMVELNSLLISYIHMSMVRLFKSKNRLHELVIYDFLYRYYKSCKARNTVENTLVIS
ncbi:MAG: thiopeptide-type bacteriocin biosynthesis protein [Flavobacterium sp.]